MSHTQGKLKYEPAYKTGFVVWGGTDSTPVEIVSSCDDEGRWGAIKDESNARRLVACWNACDGLSIEQLERAGTLDRASVSRNVAINNTINNLKDEADSLRAVNAELLEALEQSLAALEKANKEEFGPISDTIWFSEHETLFDFMGAAIASARKQGEQG